jgi:hypothetical protein
MKKVIDWVKKNNEWKGYCNAVNDRGDGFQGSYLGKIMYVKDGDLVYKASIFSKDGKEILLEIVDKMKEIKRKRQ